MKTLGIDVGSTMAKFALYDSDSGDLKLASYRVNGDPVDCVKNVFKDTKDFQDYSYMAVTGSSRYLIAEQFNAILTKPEILAQVYGIWSQELSPDLIIEIGGQDSKLILLKNNTICNFRMNSNCAAGTGAFIESQARRYGITVEELDALAQVSKSNIQLNAKCATFLESSLIDLQRKGTPKNDVYMSVFAALCQNYLASMSSDIDWNLYPNIVFVGGVAKLHSMRSNFEKLLGRQILVPEKCEYMGAIGMIELLRANINEQPKKEPNTLGPEAKQCHDCPNGCVLSKVVSDDGSDIYVGGLCNKLKKFDLKR